MRPQSVSKRHIFACAPAAAGAHENLCLLHRGWAWFADSFTTNQMFKPSVTVVELEQYIVTVQNFGLRPCTITATGIVTPFTGGSTESVLLRTFHVHNAKRNYTVERNNYT